MASTASYQPGGSEACVVEAAAACGFAAGAVAAVAVGAAAVGVASVCKTNAYSQLSIIVVIGNC